MIISYQPSGPCMYHNIHIILYKIINNGFNRDWFRYTESFYRFISVFSSCSYNMIIYYTYIYDYTSVCAHACRRNIIYYHHHHGFRSSEIGAIHSMFYLLPLSLSCNKNIVNRSSANWRFISTNAFCSITDNKRFETKKPPCRYFCFCRVFGRTKRISSK